MIGAQIFLEALRRESVSHVFGYPGGVVLKLYDEIYQQKPFEHILVRHEQAAVHAADGFARATGKTGVVLVTSGPGATNTVTGLLTAHMDSIPMVVFTGQVGTELIGNDAFQEADIVGISRPCTKHNYLVTDARDLPRIIKEAFYLASSGRPGPVLVDLPKNVSLQEVPDEEIVWPESVFLRSYQPALKGHVGQIRRFVAELLTAKKPLFYVGGGCLLADASAELRQLVSLLGMPTTQTLMALGCLDMRDDNSLGMLGMHGTFAANNAVMESDLLVSIGARFDDRVTGNLDLFAPHARIAHIDIDPTSISKNVAVDIPIVGDAKNILIQILDQLQGRESEIADMRSRIEPWREQIHTWQTEVPLTYEDSDDVIKPQKVIEEVFAVTHGEAVITSDVGQHQMWAAQFYPFANPRSWINSGGLGTMGFGYPAAMGAALAITDRPVICISGDGSFMMNLQEIATCVQYKIPVIAVILSNGYLGMVRQWQQLFFEKRYAESIMGSMPDFEKLCDAFGCLGITVSQKADLRPALEKALADGGPVIVDVKVAPEENVYPMVPSGAALNDMLLA